MDENMLGNVLRTHVTTDEPPLTLTSAGIVAAARRADRWRAGVAAAGVGGLALVATVLLPGLLRAGPPALTAQPNHLDPARYCGVAVRSMKNSLPPPTLTDPTYGGTIRVPDGEAGDLAAGLSCHVMQAISALLPDAVFDNADTYHASPEPVPLAFNGGDIVEYLDFVGMLSTQFSASAVVTDAAGIATIAFNVRSVSPAEVTAVVRSCHDDCEIRHGARGETVVVLTPPADGPAGATVVSVTVYFGQQAVTVNESNTDNRDPTRQLGGTFTPDFNQVSRPRPVTRPEPPLTVDQLIELASSPQLNIFPE